MTKAKDIEIAQIYEDVLKNNTNIVNQTEVEWIASDFVDQQRKEMKAMFEFAAANRDAASLRASTLYDRTVR